LNSLTTNIKKIRTYSLISILKINAFPISPYKIL